MNKIHPLLCCLAYCLSATVAHAQESATTPTAASSKRAKHYINLPANALYAGVGTGIDFGGNGIKVEFKPVNNFGVFASGGYNLFSFVYEAGLKWTILPHNRPIQPFLIGMYGYNTLSWVKKDGENSDYGKTFYGFTSGAGCDFITGKRRNHLSAAILVPIRDKETFEKAAMPIGISFGFSFRLGK